jgi:hypothetical protein
MGIEESYWANRGPSDAELAAIERGRGEGLQLQRLALLDALTPDGADQGAGYVDWCAWDLPIAELNEIQKNARRLHNLILAECSEWEVEQGY